MIKMAFKELGLKEIYLYVNIKNFAAIKAYQYCGFIIVEKNLDQYKMVVKNEK